MTLRIRKSTTAPTNEEGVQSEQPQGDDWSSRLVKLIPSEALTLYTSAAALITQTKTAGFDNDVALTISAIACIILIFVIRYRSTQDPATGRGPQFLAIGIALVSFLIWLSALAATGENLSPFKDFAWVVYAPLVALIWVFMVPMVYKGE
jgi:hypothetical protein